MMKRTKYSDIVQNFENFAKDSVIKHVKEEVGKSRDSETGKSPTVTVVGDDLHNLSFKVSGSPEAVKDAIKRFKD